MDLDNLSEEEKKLILDAGRRVSERLKAMGKSDAASVEDDEARPDYSGYSTEELRRKLKEPAEGIASEDGD